MAQPYGRTNYGSPSNVQAGFYTTLNLPGYFIAGLQNSSTIRVDRTNNGPGFSTGSPTIQMNYHMYYHSVSCLPNMSGMLNDLKGIDAVETHTALNGGKNYAVAGVFTRGCFLMMLNASGTGTVTGTYLFPYPTDTIDKPCIAEASNGDLLIAGRFDTSMYVLRAAPSGSLIWSALYSIGHDTGAGGNFDPADILESPFNHNVVITGRATGSFSSGRTIDGFFLTLNQTNGAVVVFKTLGDAIPGQCNFFTSMTPALSSMPGSQGFVLAGMSDPTAGVSDQAWMVKVDQFGTMIWDGQYACRTNPSPGTNIFVDVVERMNTNGQYEYYGLCNTAGTVYGDIILKLDKDGKPYSVNHSGLDEYLHSTTASAATGPVSLTYTQSTGGNVGLHVFSESLTGAGPSLLTCYFNGVSGCADTRTTIANYTIGHNSVSHWINTYGSLTRCDVVTVDHAPLSYAIQQPCMTGTVTGGNNARQMDVTGIDELTASEGIRIFPNPSSGGFTITTDRPVTLQISNELGQQVRTMVLGETSYTEKVNDLPAGIYFIKDKSGSVKQKLIVSN